MSIDGYKSHGNIMKTWLPILAIITIAVNLIGCKPDEKHPLNPWPFGSGGESLGPGVGIRGFGSPGDGLPREFPMRFMTERGHPASLSIFTESQLPIVLEKNPRLPTTEDDIRGLANCIFTGENGGRICGETYTIRSGATIALDESDMAENMLFLALRNPRIPDTLREEMDLFISQQLPYIDLNIMTKKAGVRPAITTGLRLLAGAAPNAQYGPCTDGYTAADSGYAQCLTDRFWVTWYWKPNAYAPLEATLTDAEIFETINYLNTAWDVYEQALGSENVPDTYWINDFQKKLMISFIYFNYNWDTELYGKTNLAYNFIALNPVKWNEIPGIRKPVTAHELFHRVQYKLGYQTEPGYDTYDWFVEGTASWAEAFVWNRTSANIKYTHFYDHPFYNILFDYEESFFAKKAYAAVSFWHYFDRHLGKMIEMFLSYKEQGSVLVAVNNVLFNEFHKNGIFNNFEDYLALWRRDKIVQAHAPVEILKPDGNPVGPLQANLKRTRHLTQSNSNWTGVFSMHSSGTEYGAIYIDPVLKGAGKTLTIDFEPFNAPVAPMQYQIIFARCNVSTEACGIPDYGFNVSNIPAEDYQVLSVLYPFHQENIWQYSLPLDSGSIQWDLIFLVIGNRLLSGGQEYVNVTVTVN